MIRFKGGLGQSRSRVGSIIIYVTTELNYICNYMQVSFKRVMNCLCFILYCSLRSTYAIKIFTSKTL